MKIIRTVALPVLMLTSLLLTGCSVFAPIQLTPVATYTLRNDHDIQTMPKTAERHDTLFVMQPSATPAYRSDRLLNLTKSQELQSLPHSAWVAPPAQLLLALLSERLQNSGYFRAVVTPPFIGLSDFRLETTVLAFDRRHIDNTLAAEIGLQILLVNSKTNRVLASQRFVASEPVANLGSSAFVNAMNNAVNRVLTEVVTFVGQQIKNNQHER